MAFKTARQYNEEKFGGLFLLRNDGDSADVIFLYRNLDDVLIADTHYIKSADYSGYVHCCGRGCPACEKGIRVQTKLFIPMYNLTTNQIEFWDRNVRFENQLSQDVFERYPNPSEFVFRITRHGVAGDVNTTYQIQAIGRNTAESYDQILAKFHITMPDYYEKVCRAYDSMKLSSMLSSSAAATSSLPDYQVTPRVSATAVSTFETAELSIPDVSDEFPEDVIASEEIEKVDESEDVIF